LFPQSKGLEGAIKDRKRYRVMQQDVERCLENHLNVCRAISEAIVSYRHDDGKSKDERWKVVEPLIRMIVKADGGARYIMEEPLRELLKRGSKAPSPVRVLVYILLCPMEDRIAISGDANTVVLLKKFEDVIKQGLL
jgi:hypothetical protein